MLLLQLNLIPGLQGGSSPFMEGQDPPITILLHSGSPAPAAAAAAAVEEETSSVVASLI